MACSTASGPWDLHYKIMNFCIKIDEFCIPGIYKCWILGRPGGFHLTVIRGAAFGAIFNKNA